MKPVSTVRYLGLIIDEHLTFSNQVALLKKDIAARMASFARGRSCLTPHGRRQFYVGFVQSKLEYASNSYVHCLSAQLYDQLVKISKRSIRILWGAAYDAHSAPLFAKLRLNPISARYNLKLYMLVHRVVHGTCSALLSNMFQFSSAEVRCTRGSNSHLLKLPHVLTRSGLFSVSFIAADRWNSLPFATRQLSLSRKFRQACLAHLGCPAGPNKAQRRQ